MLGAVWLNYYGGGKMNSIYLSSGDRASPISMNEASSRPRDSSSSFTSRITSAVSQIFRRSSVDSHGEGTGQSSTISANVSRDAFSHHRSLPNILTSGYVTREEVLNCSERTYSLPEIGRRNGEMVINPIYEEDNYATLEPVYEEIINHEYAEIGVNSVEEKREPIYDFASPEVEGHEEERMAVSDVPTPPPTPESFYGFFDSELENE